MGLGHARQAPGEGSRPRRRAGALLLAAVLLGGCAAPPPSLQVPCGGSAGSTASWCTERDFPGKLPTPTPEALRAAADALAASCPPATAEDAAPGLSPAARAVRKPRLLYRSLALLRRELAELERFLVGMAPHDPRRRSILHRLADGYVYQEALEHTECRETLIVPADTTDELAAIRFMDHALVTVQPLRGAREGAARTCAILRREYPDQVPGDLCPPRP
jgi:hypothetical protein